MMTHLTDSQRKLIKSIEDVMDIDDIFKVSREQRYIDSRMMLFTYLNRVSGYNYTEISRIAGIGSSSVSNSIESFEGKIAYNQRLEDVWSYVNYENSNKISSDNEDNVKASIILDKLIDRSKVEFALSKFNMIITGINGL